MWPLTARRYRAMPSANLISNLQKTGFFKNIEIKESYQDDAIKDMQAFQFTLTCEKAKS